jgi:hypothetical protein
MREVIVDLSVAGAQCAIMLEMQGNVTVKDINLGSRKDEGGHNWPHSGRGAGHIEVKEKLKVIIRTWDPTKICEVIIDLSVAGLSMPLCWRCREIFQ